MNVQIFLSILSFSLPMFSGLICLGMVFPWPGKNIGTADAGVQKVLAFYLFTAAFGWFSMLVYHFFPVFATYIQSFIYLSFLLIQLMFYHFVFVITKFDQGERFSPLHYIVPFLIFGTLVIWSFFVPFDVQVALIKNKGELVPGYEVYSKFFLSKIMGRLIFSVIYTILALVRILRYRKGVADFSSNETRSSLAWVNVLIIISFCFLVMPVCAMITGRAAMYASMIPLFTALLVATQHIILTYNSIKGNYITIDSNTPYGDDTGPRKEGLIRIGGREIDPDKSSSPKKLVAEEFTKFMMDQKPYLDADLKITDLAELLGTNRAYLSSFINTTYGMNFSRYINTLRLGELDRILSCSDTAGLPLSKQIARAGFGSYRNYKRFRGSRE